MRGAWLVLACAGCSPEIVSGSYLCGDEMYCPSDQVCNGPDNTCVLPGVAQAFACDPMVDNEPDDTIAQATKLPALTCVSSPFVKQGCLHDGDPADWVELTAPTGCTAIEVQVRVTYPIAFEPVTVELWDAVGNSMIAGQGECVDQTTAPGDDSKCIQMTISGGGTYAVGVKPAGTSDCGGSCAHNRYTLTVQLATPG